MFSCSGLRILSSEQYEQEGWILHLNLPDSERRRTLRPRRARGLYRGVHLSFFSSFVFGTPGFPLSDVPLQAIANDVASGRYKAKPPRVFRFEEIREAHKVMESGQTGGKMVVRV